MSVEDFLKKAFKYVKLDYKKHLIIDKKLFRKKDSHDTTSESEIKFNQNLKWKRKFNFRFARN